MYSHYPYTGRVIIASRKQDQNMENNEVLAAVILSILFTQLGFIQGRDCLMNTPEFRDQGEGGVPRLDNSSLLYLIPAYTFSCHGKVTQWGACVESRGGWNRYTIIFYVFRPSIDPGQPSCYSQVGRNTIMDAIPEKGCVTLDVQSVDQISIQPGDVVGFQPQSSNSVKVGIEIDVSVTGVTTWGVTENVATGEATCLYTASEGNLPTSTLVAPVITAVVEGYLSTAVIVGITIASVAGVAVAVLLVLVLTVLLICCYSRNKAKASVPLSFVTNELVFESPEPDYETGGSIQMVTCEEEAAMDSQHIEIQGNEAYQTIDTKIPTEQNTAYGSAVDTSDEDTVYELLPN